MSKKSLRTHFIKSRVTEYEFNFIKEKSLNTGLPVSSYIRNLSMNYPLKSVVDQRALSELIKCRADLGRIGGLFKMWLVAEKETKLKLGQRTYKTIDELVNHIELKQDEILELSKILLRVKE